MSKQIIDIGSIVDYHSIIGGDITSKDHTVTHIQRQPNNFGTDVAWVTGKSGCVCLDALTLSIFDIVGE
jgi:hypothetical protein